MQSSRTLYDFEDNYLNRFLNSLELSRTDVAKIIIENIIPLNTRQRIIIIVTKLHLLWSLRKSHSYLLAIRGFSKYGIQRSIFIIDDELPCSFNWFMFNWSWYGRKRFISKSKRQRCWVIAISLFLLLFYPIIFVLLGKMIPNGFFQQICLSIFFND